MLATNANNRVVSQIVAFPEQYDEHGLKRSTNALPSHALRVLCRHVLYSEIC